MHGLDRRIRTSGLLVPGQALYRTELYPDGQGGWIRTTVIPRSGRGTIARLGDTLMAASGGLEPPYSRLTGVPTAVVVRSSKISLGRTLTGLPCKHSNNVSYAGTALSFLSAAADQGVIFWLREWVLPPLSTVYETAEETVYPSRNGAPGGTRTHVSPLRRRLP
jgi:hypothetical protein